MIQLHFINTKHKPQVYITIKYLIVYNKKNNSEICNCVKDLIYLMFIYNFGVIELINFKFKL